METLTQDQRLHTKEYFNLWSESSSFPKVSLFLSFQTDQNIHKGVICQALLRLFLTKTPFHPRRVAFTVHERVQDTLKREKKRFHRTRILTQ